MIAQLIARLPIILSCIEVVVDIQSIYGVVQKEVLMIKIAVTIILVVIALMKDCFHAVVSNSDGTSEVVQEFAFRPSMTVVSIM